MYNIYPARFFYMISYLYAFFFFFYFIIYKAQFWFWTYLLKNSPNTRIWWTLKFIFLENEALRENILFYVFNLFSLVE